MAVLQTPKPATIPTVKIPALPSLPDKTVALQKALKEVQPLMKAIADLGNLVVTQVMALKAQYAGIKSVIAGIKSKIPSV
jgi:hypothetical protein